MKKLTKLFALGAMTILLPLTVKAEAVFTFDCAATSLAKGATTQCTIAGQDQTDEGIAKVNIQVMKATLEGLDVKSFTPNESLWTATKNDTTNLRYELSIKSGAALPVNLFQVGAITVQLRNDATDCGTICVNVTYFKTATGTELTALSGVDPNPQTAEGSCEDITIAGTTSPGTGSFVDYVVLIGAAGIALGATALSRKKTKFYRV